MKPYRKTCLPVAAVVFRGKGLGSRLASALAVLLLLVTISGLLFGTAPPSSFAGSLLQAEATATLTPASAVPPAAETSLPPAPVSTVPGEAVTVPVPEETREAQARAATEAALLPTATIDSSTLPSDAPAGSTPAAGPGGTAGSTTGPSEFPWLPLILVGALLLGGLLYLLSRRRSPEPAVVVATPERPEGAMPYGSQPGQSTTTSVTTVAAPPSSLAATTATPAAAPVPPVPFVPPVALPTTLDCPNCGTSNGLNENFCHECGQDLRPTRAAIVAAHTPPPEVVTDTTPYLETLSRVDEQLEYVLSRPMVVIGTAPGSDIVIDSLFAGWETVDATHAELRRESDGFVLVDRGSSSGTFVNEMRTGENLLSNGDEIRLGDVRFLFRVPS